MGRKTLPYSTGACPRWMNWMAKFAIRNKTVIHKRQYSPAWRAIKLEPINSRRKVAVSS
jgi:hypothetical protein